MVAHLESTKSLLQMISELQAKQQKSEVENQVLKIERNHAARVHEADKEVFASKLATVEAGYETKLESSKTALVKARKLKTNREANFNKLKATTTERYNKLEKDSSQRIKTLERILRTTTEQRDFSTDQLDAKDNLIAEKDTSINELEAKLRLQRLKVSKLACAKKVDQAVFQANNTAIAAQQQPITSVYLNLAHQQGAGHFATVKQLENSFHAAVAQGQALFRDVGVQKSLVIDLQKENRALLDRNIFLVKTNDELAMDRNAMHDKGSFWYNRFQVLNTSCNDQWPALFETDKQIKDLKDVIAELKDGNEKLAKERNYQCEQVEQAKRRVARFEAKSQLAVSLYKRAEQTAKDLRAENASLQDALTRRLPQDQVLAAIQSRTQTVNTMNTILLADLDETQEKLEKAENAKAALVHRTDFRVKNIKKSQDEALEELQSIKAQKLEVEMELEVSKNETKAQVQMIADRDHDIAQLATERDHLLTNHQYRGAKLTVDSQNAQIRLLNESIVAWQRQANLLTEEAAAKAQVDGGYVRQNAELNVVIKDLREELADLKTKAEVQPSLQPTALPDPNMTLLHNFLNGRANAPPRPLTPIPTGPVTAADLGPLIHHEDYSWKDQIDLVTASTDQNGRNIYRKENWEGRKKREDSMQDGRKIVVPVVQESVETTQAPATQANVQVGISLFSGMRVEIDASEVDQAYEASAEVHRKRLEEICKRHSEMTRDWVDI